jgi:hypothetical protein
LSWLRNNRALSLAGAVAFVLVLLAAPAVVMAQGDATGFLEICKQADSPAVSGTFQFTVAGRSVSVPVGACSPALSLPTGPVTVTELAVEGFSVADVRTAPPERLLGRDTTAGTAQVTISPGDLSAQTTVTFTNRAEVSPLKICKVAGDGVAVGSTFTFSVGATTVSVPAGPAPGGYCAVAGSFPVAANLVVSESVPRGLEVAAISVEPPARLVGVANPSGGTVVVRIGSGVTEAVFTNRASPPTVVAPTTTTTPSSGVSPTSVVPLPTTTSTRPGVAPTTVPPAPTTTVPPAPATTSPPTLATSTTVAPSTTTTTRPCTSMVPPTAPTPPSSAPTATTVPCANLVPTTLPPSVATTTTAPPSGTQTITTLPPATTTTAPPTGVVPTTLAPAPTTTTPPGPQSPPTTVVPTASPPGLFQSSLPRPLLLVPTPSPSPRTQLSQTGADVRRLLSAGLAMIAAGVAFLAVDRRRRAASVAVASVAAVAVAVASDDFPALTFEPTVRWTAADALDAGAGGWPAGPRPGRGRSRGPDVETGASQAAGQPGSGIHAHRRSWLEAGGHAQGGTHRHQGGVVLRQLALATGLPARRDRRLPPVLVQAGIDRP